MNNTIEKLEKRIKRLKADVQARNDWLKLRREIEKHGGKWRADNGMVYVLKDGVIYQYASEFEQGVSNLVITSLDGPVPFVAVLDHDLQGTPPHKRKALLRELEQQVKKNPAPAVELIHIVEGDWLSKISESRWGTIHWQQHLKPTEMTLLARKKKNMRFDEDLIYPGDTFQVK